MPKNRHLSSVPGSKYHPVTKFNLYTIHRKYHHLITNSPCKLWAQHCRCSLIKKDLRMTRYLSPCTHTSHGHSSSWHTGDAGLLYPPARSASDVTNQADTKNRHCACASDMNPSQPTGPRRHSRERRGEVPDIVTRRRLVSIHSIRRTSVSPPFLGEKKCVLWREKYGILDLFILI